MFANIHVLCFCQEYIQFQRESDDAIKRSLRVVSSALGLPLARETLASDAAQALQQKCQQRPSSSNDKIIDLEPLLNGRAARVEDLHSRPPKSDAGLPSAVGARQPQQIIQGFKNNKLRVMNETVETKRRCTTRREDSISESDS